MSEPAKEPITAKCGNCNAWMMIQEGVGYCRANPPTPIVVGIAKPSLAITRQQAAPQPVVEGHFPPMQAVGWCRQHEPI